MEAKAFFKHVVDPNWAAFASDPGSLRKAANCLLTLDACVGILAVNRSLHDRELRDQLADKSIGYRLARDAAFSLKHGRLDHRTKLPRLIGASSEIQTRAAAWADETVLDDDLVLADMLVAFEFVHKESRFCIRADAIAREAVSCVSADIFGSSYDPISMSTLQSMGILT